MSDTDLAALERNLRSGNATSRDLQHAKRQAIRWLSLLPEDVASEALLESRHGPITKEIRLLVLSDLWGLWHNTPAEALLAKASVSFHFIKDRDGRQRTITTACDLELSYDKITATKISGYLPAIIEEMCRRCASEAAHRDSEVEILHH